MARGPISDAKRCTVIKADGERCGAARSTGKDVCFRHDPAWGAEDKLCTARISGGYDHRDRAGERCKNFRMTGLTVCAMHGGAAKQVRAAGRRRAAEKEVLALVATFGLPRDITPEAALLEEIHRTAGAVAWLEAQIRELDPDELTWGITKVKEGGEDRGTTEEAAPHALLRVYQHERAHLVKVCTEAIRVGIEARQVKLAEDQGAMVAQAVRAILDDLQLTPGQRALIPAIVPRHLRELALRN